MRIDGLTLTANPASPVVPLVALSNSQLWPSSVDPWRLYCSVAALLAILTLALEGEPVCAPALAVKLRLLGFAERMEVPVTLKLTVTVTCVVWPAAIRKVPL